MSNSKSGDVILVVDDSPDTLTLVNDTLEQAGFSVLVALEGKQALTITQRIRPDMILLDAVMPHLDGFDTCRELKKIPELASIPVIFMTGLSDTDNIVKGLEVGGVDYLTKPINPEELVARMKVHLSNARLTSSAYSALDSAGQFLFSINARGETVWATPQTYALLARARVDNDADQGEFARQLREWLAHTPEPSQQLSFNHIGYPLAAVFVEPLSDDEKLLKLIDNRRPAGDELLRARLGLTPRESEVLLWVSNGKANRDIAQILGMSPRTVNKHLEQIFRKLGVENRTAAARRAISALAEGEAER